MWVNISERGIEEHLVHAQSTHPLICTRGYGGTMEAASKWIPRNHRLVSKLSGSCCCRFLESSECDMMKNRSRKDFYTYCRGIAIGNFLKPMQSEGLFLACSKFESICRRLVDWFCFHRLPDPLYLWYLYFLLGDLFLNAKKTSLNWPQTYIFRHL